MTRLEGSIAASAFGEAEAELAATPLSSPHLRPAIDYSLVSGLLGWPPTTSRPGRPADEAPAGAPEPQGPIWDAGRRLAAGETTCRALVEEALAVVAARNDELGGLVDVQAERALVEADQRDDELRRGRPRGPLHGVPLSVKDVIDVGGMPTRGGSAAYLDVPTDDAESVARLRIAGAVVVGKAATHEFALGVTSPQSRNPHDPTRIPGGSSGGSAVAVATGMSLGSLGTDTRASIRVPSALSGVVGLKPTYGRVPTGGVLSLSWTMDHVAPMAASVADAALLLDVLAGEPAGTWWGRASAVPWPELRVGVPQAAFEGAAPGVLAAVASAVAGLADAGCELDDAVRPSRTDLDLASAAGLVVSRAEAATIHRSLGLDRGLYWAEVAEQLDAADRVSALDYLQAQRLRRDLATGLLAAFDRHDVLVMPTVAVVAPLAEDFAAYLMVLARNAIPWSFVGFPAISVPCGATGGLPVGLQVVARPGREDLVLAVGAAVEALSPARLVPGSAARGGAVR
jgi:Asp-tRNA(Asn)/Glu-tRNA(Gln) amidotransferase A subunit family amidase